MREFALDITEPCHKGLRTYKAPTNNPAGLHTCYALVPRDAGLSPYTRLTDSLADSLVDVSWPFPQLFVGRSETLLLTETVIYTFVPATGLATAITTYDALAPSSTKAITGSGVWHFVDYGKAWYLYNGTSVVFRDNRNGMQGGTNNVLVYNNTQIGTACDLKGRMVFGGFGSTFWNTGWNEIIARCAEEYPTPIEPGSDIPDNMILWSSVGGGDVSWLMMPELALGGNPAYTGLYTGLDSLLQAFERNEFGFMALPFTGSVTTLKQLGNTAIAYGTNSLYALYNADAPVNTLGLRTVSEGLGIKGRGCVAGDLYKHVFIGQDDNLYSIDAELKLQKLGYKEYMSALTGTIQMSYNMQEKEFYISGSNRCFVLGINGLGEATELVTSQYVSGGVESGVTSPLTATAFTLITDVYDMGFRGLKHVPYFLADVSGATSLRGALYRQYDKSVALSAGSYINANKEGVVHVNTTTQDFMVAITGTSTSSFRLNDINVRYSGVDNRARRGL